MNILVVEDDAFVREALSSYLREIGHAVTEAKDGEAGFHAATKNDFELVITDVCMPRMSGIELLRKLKNNHGKTTDIVLMTGNDDVALSRHDAINEGAFEYIRKPESPDELNDILNRVSEDIETRRENVIVEQKFNEVMSISSETIKEEIRSSMAGMEAPLTYSDHTRQIFQTAEKLGANMNVPVIIEGENGTGKGILAKYIHRFSPCKNAPFVSLNCGAIPLDVLPKELFGHETPIVSGAIKGGRRGKLELAGNGTIVLEDIQELPKDIQLRLLKTLQSKKFYRIDGSMEVPFNARIIACSSRSLSTEVQKGTLDEELYNHLNIGYIKAPALRERRDEIIPLAKNFLEMARSKYGEMLPLGFSQEAIEFIRAHHWSGNIKELKNSIERIVLMEDSRYIFPEHFRFLSKSDSTANSERSNKMSSKNRFQLPPEGIRLDNHVLDIIQQAYDMSEGNKTAAAQLLGISPWAFNRKLKKLGGRR